MGVGFWLRCRRVCVEDGLETPLCPFCAFCLCGEALSALITTWTHSAVNVVPLKHSSQLNSESRSLSFGIRLCLHSVRSPMFIDRGAKQNPLRSKERNGAR